MLIIAFFVNIHTFLKISVREIAVILLEIQSNCSGTLICFGFDLVDL